jgi:DNA-directed RNA polymerase specialized sigma24 family protein
MVNKDDEERYTRLVAADWGDIFPALVNHVVKIARLYGSVNDSTDLGLGQTAQDIAQDIVRKAFSGERQWDYTNVDLLSWLKGQARSELSNHYHLAQNRFERAALELDAPVSNDGDKSMDGVQIQGGEGADQPILAAEEQLEFKRKTQLVLEATKDDPDLEGLILALYDGHPRKPSVLAEVLGVPVERIYILMRRMRRIIAREGIRP